MAIAGAIGAVFLGSLLEPAFDPVSSMVRDAIVDAYKKIPYVPKPAPSEQRRIACRDTAVDGDWGPDRRMYRWSRPAPFLTMNSLADNPIWGLEATLIKVRHAGTKRWCLRVNADIGDALEFVVYLENSSGSNLNLVARDLRVRIRRATFRDRAIVRAFISTSNATPRVVWSDVAVAGVSAVELMPVKGSARIISSHDPKPGKKLPGDLWSQQGALVGPTIPVSGILNGEASNSFYVLFRARVAPHF